MLSRRIIMLRPIIFMCALLAGAANVSAAEAGRVVFVTGKAQLAAKPAVLEAAVQEGDELSTGADGYIYMKTVDNGFLILRPNSKARVVTYKIDNANPRNTHVKFELLSGVARSISGDSVKQARQNFRFNTPVAAIGVRGTDFIVHTNQQTSWVSVVSGGVVVSGFAGACGPEGSGPCEGSSSRELFADRANMTLQIQRGQNVPVLTSSPVIAPELIAPPRSDEPVGKVTTPAVPAPNATTTINNINLDPAKSNAAPVTAGNGNTPGNSGGTPSTPTPPPVVVVPDPLPSLPGTGPAPAAQEVIWGRWRDVAGVAPDPVVSAKMRDGSYNQTVFVDGYMVARKNDSSFVLPTEGKASFTMQNYEANISKAGGPGMAAEVKNAKLDVDFVARSFDTSLTVLNSLGQVNFVSKGSVTREGGLESSVSSSSRVSGYLGGAKVNEAVYGFSGSQGDLSTAGVIRWGR
jgi:hypothetical protein